MMNKYGLFILSFSVIFSTAASVKAEEVSVSLKHSIVSSVYLEKIGSAGGAGNHVGNAKEVSIYNWGDSDPDINGFVGFTHISIDGFQNDSPTSDSPTIDYIKMTFLEMGVGIKNYTKKRNNKDYSAFILSGLIGKVDIREKNNPGFDNKIIQSLAYGFRLGIESAFTEHWGGVISAQMIKGGGGKQRITVANIFACKYFRWHPA